MSGLSLATSTVFRERHGLARRSPRAEQAIWLAADPVLVPPAPDWPDGVVQTAAIRPPLDRSWTPPEPLAEFLAAGPSPVYVGLGSLNDAGGDEWRRLIVAAARQSGRRVLTPAPPGTEPQVVDELVCTLGAVPHDPCCRGWPE